MRRRTRPARPKATAAFRPGPRTCSGASGAAAKTSWRRHTVDTRASLAATPPPSIGQASRGQLPLPSLAGAPKVRPPSLDRARCRRGSHPIDGRQSFASPRLRSCPGMGNCHSPRSRSPPASPSSATSRVSSRRSWAWPRGCGSAGGAPEPQPPRPLPVSSYPAPPLPLSTRRRPSSAWAQSSSSGATRAVQPV